MSGKAKKGRGSGAGSERYGRRLAGIYQDLLAQQRGGKHLPDARQFLRELQEILSAPK